MKELEWKTTEHIDENGGFIVHSSFTIVDIEHWKGEVYKKMKGFNVYVNVL